MEREGVELGELMNNYKAKGGTYQDAAAQVTELSQGHLTQIWKHKEGGIFRHPQLSRPGSYWNTRAIGKVSSHVI